MGFFGFFWVGFLLPTLGSRWGRTVRPVSALLSPLFRSNYRQAGLILLPSGTEQSSTVKVRVAVRESYAYRFIAAHTRSWIRIL